MSRDSRVTRCSCENFRRIDAVIRCTSRQTLGVTLAQPIEDYALIGNARTGALVGKDGSIDWLCVPRFDAPACFAALLGDSDNGCWRIAPSAPVRRVRRNYRPGTLVLETEFECDGGRVKLVDCMLSESAGCDVVRIVQGIEGSVPMHMRFIVRFDYGSIVPWVEKTTDGLRATAGPDSVLLRSFVPMRGVDFTTVSDFTIEAGAQLPFHLIHFASHEPVPLEVDVIAACESVTQWWRAWSSRVRAPSRWRQSVERSLITLKAMTYGPAGGIVAALTTSLPEQIGGVRNWDYRYCWVRDAAFTLNALLRAGYRDEAAQWRQWLVRAAAGRPQDLSILYGLAGERRVEECELPWLSGYCGSRPVRVGNAAYTQFQLDVYGEVMDTLHLAEETGLESQARVWELQRVLLDFLESSWQKPDYGIWEMRGPARHFTYSKVMAWVAFDRAVQAVERFELPGPVARWRSCRARIHEEVCTLAYDPARRAFMQSYDRDRLDASVLKMLSVGFLPATDERMIGTVRAIERELTRDGLVLRYATAPHIDGLPPGEGVFLPCSFWLCDALAATGEYERAVHLFERLLDLRNDVGLLSEEYDPASGRFLGNFPQAISHVALINTARNLETHERCRTGIGYAND
jgi:GH15 family glucan-1,4-alpha-glucosidase